MKKQLKASPAWARFIISSVVIFVLIYALFVFTASIVKHSDYFKIKYVINKEGSTDRFLYLKGYNTFDLNLKKEARRILEQNSDYRQVRLIRILPDKLFIDFLRRKPVAYTKLNKYFLIDDNMVLFDVTPESVSLDLPVISGLEKKILAPHPGKAYNIPELTLSLDIIREISLNKGLKDYKLKRINIASAVNASFFLLKAGVLPLQLLEVKLSSAEVVKDKINILAGLVSQAKGSLGNIEYIDLRFKEAVVKPKNEK